MRLLEEELSGSNKNNDNLISIALNALDYIRKNLKSFGEILV